ncbi:MAG: hypothetical protein E7641_01090 [Ruminococcaceae bacterium]|nr:hypothetical protein [Oscillospiraceae bacterium]
MKNSYSINVRLSEDMLKRLLYICEAEKRTPSNQFNFMLRNNIAYFERTKGKIPEAKLREIDISEFLEGDKSEN